MSIKFERWGYIKRIFTTLFFISLFGINAHSQSSIAGVRFGDKFENISDILIVKFGKPDSIDEKEIVFSDSYYAGFYFDLIIFGFQRETNDSHLNRCIFLKSFETADRAKQYRDDIAQELKRRYKLMTEIGSNGFKCYYGGTDPTDNNRDGFCLEILSPTPEIKWYGVRLYYGPYNYLDEEF